MNRLILSVILAIIGVTLLGSIIYFGMVEYKNYQKYNILQADLNETFIKKIYELERNISQLEDEKSIYEKEQSKEGDILWSKIGILAQKNRELQKSQESLKITENSDIVEKVKPAIVYIKAGDKSGSGFIINSTGSIITNAHVVKGVSSPNIKLSDGRSFVGSVVGRNEEVDIAIVKIDTNDLRYLQLGDSSSSALKQGDRVLTFGYPFGLSGEVSIKEGTISRRLYDGDTTYLETSAEIHPGNSGGPLVDSDGFVIGVNVAILGKSINGVLIGETIKLAIPINIVKDLIIGL